MIYSCSMIASNRQRRLSVFLIILVLIGCERVPRLSSQDVPPTVSVPIGSPGAATTTSAVTVTAGPNTSGRPLTLASLDNPRSIAVGPQSEIYIADSGIPSEPYSGRVVKIDAVTRRIEPVIEGFANSPVAEGTGSYISGVSSIALHGNMLYVVTGAGAWLNDPFYAPNKLLKRISDGAWIEVFDFTGFEYLVDPDGNGPNSNAYGVAVSMDGDVWVSDAGGNWVARLTEDGAVAAYATFPQVNGEDAVPTGIAIGPDGSAYVTLFRCQEPTRGKGGIVRVTPDGTARVVVSGLSNPIAVAFDSAGTMYVLEFAIDYKPRTGTLIRIGNDGRQDVILSGLMYPTSLAIDRSGVAYITGIARVTGGSAGTGALMRFALPETISGKSLD